MDIIPSLQGAIGSMQDLHTANCKYIWIESELYLCQKNYTTKNGITDECSTSDCCPLLIICPRCCPRHAPDDVTGWSKKTVTCNFFLADLKVIKNCITQTFLKKVHREVLIFWYHNRVEWKKITPFTALPKKMNFGQKCNYLTKTVFFWPKWFFLLTLPQKNFTIMKGQQKTMFLWWPCCMVAVKAAVGAHFWPKKCTFGQISAFLAQNQFLAQS